MSQPVAVRADERVRRQYRRVAAATLIGTTIEWYDFFIYATASGLVFADAFFRPASTSVGVLLAFASIGVSFVFRPLGALVSGYLGDRLGRRGVLVATLVLMGVATCLTGLLPSYASIGALAPILLVALRVLQGLSAGGEWGGAVLMAVEHAPDGKRSRMGMFPQLGVPLGMLLAAGSMSLMSGVVAPGAAFLDWGWRVPFVFSIVLVGLGYYVRRRVSETPVFAEIANSARRQKLPIVTVFRRSWLVVILAALLFAGLNAAGYLITGGYFTTYVTAPDGPVGMDRSSALLAVTLCGFAYLFWVLLGGYLGDVIGRKRTTLIGYLAQLLLTVPVFVMVGTKGFWWFTAALCLWYLGVGVTYGPQAAWYVELFPASIRYSGTSIAYALGSVLGGAFAPLIAQALTNAWGITAVAVYMAVMTVLAIAAACLLRDRRRIGLGVEHEREQQEGSTVFSRGPRVGEGEAVVSA